MPDELTVDGVRYVRAEDALTINGVTYVPERRARAMSTPVIAQASPDDDLMTVAQIRELTGKSINAINEAMNADVLPYSVPNGCKRPRRARRSAVMAWIEGRAARAEA